MIKSFGYAALVAFFVLGTQIGSVDSGFVYFIYILIMIAIGVTGIAFVQMPKVLQDGSSKKIIAFKTFEPKKFVGEIEGISMTIRRDGLLASEGARKELSDPFMRYLLKRVMDGYERTHLVQSIRNQSMRTHEIASLVEAWNENVTQSFATIGLITTLFQMMAVLKSTDPNANPASALLPLLIGVLFQPLASAYLKNAFFANLDRARLYYILLEEGVSGIQEGLNADLLRDKLNCRLLETPKLVES